MSILTFSVDWTFIHWGRFCWLSGLSFLAYCGFMGLFLNNCSWLLHTFSDNLSNFWGGFEASLTLSSYVGSEVVDFLYGNIIVTYTSVILWESTVCRFSLYFIYQIGIKFLLCRQHLVIDRLHCLLPNICSQHS